MVRPLKAAMVSSTKPDSLSVSVWIITWTSWSSATDSAQSMAAGVVPQSSCSLRQEAPPSIISTSALGLEALPLPAKARFIGKASAASIMRARCQGPRVGEQGVDGAIGARDLSWPNAVADPLAAADLHLLAVGGEVLLHLDDEIGVGEPHLVTGGGAEHVGIGGARHFHRHGGPLYF